MKRILTIAGSDSGGGAGIQADLKAITVLGEYGMSVLTALTAQNTLGVQGVHEVPIDFIRLQLDAVLNDIGADAAKTGMLSSPEIVKCVAAGLRDHKVENIVVDPVMVAASGDPLLSRDAVEILKAELLPLATMLTPNLAEASILCGFPVNSLDDMKAAAEMLAGLGPKYILVKGGHLPDRAIDVLYDGQSIRTFDGPRIDTDNTHGTGCTISAALASFLARGLSPVEAAEQAKAFITSAIRASIKIGSGHGPTNPFAHVAGYIEKDNVLKELGTALEKMLQAPIGFLIPEIRSNLGYALPNAASREDVAAIPGRISQIGDRVVACSGPAFGASSHVAKVILAAMNRFPETRSAIAIRYEPEILAACRDLNLVMAEFSRADEPPEVKAREGSSLEWGTGHAIKDMDQAPDVVHDAGEVGKEPITRVLGRDPMEVVEKITAIAGKVKGES